MQSKIYRIHNVLLKLIKNSQKYQTLLFSISKTIAIRICVLPLMPKSFNKNENRN